MKTQEESTQNVTVNGTRDSQSTTQNLDPDKEFLIRSSFRLGGRIEGAVMPYYVLIFFYTLLPLRSQVTKTRFSSGTPW